MTEETTEYRVLPRQLRNLLIGTVAFFMVAVILGIVGDIAHSGRAWGLSITLGVCSLVYIYCCFAYRTAWTRFGPHGISGRGLMPFSQFEYRWDQIANVAYRVFSGKGSTMYTMTLTTVSGKRVRLAVPMSGTLTEDSEFHDKFSRIHDSWQSSTELADPEQDTKSSWSWRRAGLVVLWVAAILVQVFMLLAICLPPPNLPWTEYLIPSGIFLLILAAQVGFPLYLRRRRRRRATEAGTTQSG